MSTGAQKIKSHNHNTNSQKTGRTPLRHVCMCVRMYIADNNIELCTRGRESLDGSFQEIGAGTLLERRSNVLDEGTHIGTEAIVQVFCSYAPGRQKRQYSIVYYTHQWYKHGGGRRYVLRLHTFS